MTATHRAFVLHSGGLDSTVALYWARQMYGPKNVTALGVKYGQRHQKVENLHAEMLCGQLACGREELDLTKVMAPGGLTDETFEVPDISYADIKGVSPTYVPFRNGTLLSAAAGRAQSWVGNDTDRTATILYGAHAEDAENWAYPDCTPEFIGAMAAAIYIGTYHTVRVVAPFQHLMKSQLVKIGTDLGVPFDMTWSCYKGGEKHCGKCPTCISRHGAFVLANIKDPTVYEYPPVRPEEM